ncbi:ethanolamine ammonia-lyase light subunit [Klebsiella aerogenes]|nr:ethanolamine ammonia-lyase light subunit [Klebsiella aerogenes]
MNRPDAWNPLREFTDARIAPGPQRRQPADPRSP